MRQPDLALLTLRGRVFSRGVAFAGLQRARCTSYETPYPSATTQK